MSMTQLSHSWNTPPHPAILGNRQGARPRMEKGREDRLTFCVICVALVFQFWCDAVSPVADGRYRIGREG